MNLTLIQIIKIKILFSYITQRPNNTNGDFKDQTLDCRTDVYSPENFGHPALSKCHFRVTLFSSSLKPMNLISHETLSIVSEDYKILLQVSI